MRLIFSSGSLLETDPFGSSPPSCCARSGWGTPPNHTVICTCKWSIAGQQDLRHNVETFYASLNKECFCWSGWWDGQYRGVLRLHLQLPSPKLSFKVNMDEHSNCNIWTLMTIIIFWPAYKGEGRQGHRESSTILSSMPAARTQKCFSKFFPKYFSNIFHSEASTILSSMQVSSQNSK